MGGISETAIILFFAPFLIVDRHVNYLIKSEIMNVRHAYAYHSVNICQLKPLSDGEPDRTSVLQNIQSQSIFQMKNYRTGDSLFTGR